jgi:diguanylate cyclase (GGDEF)-like protein
MIQPEEDSMPDALDPLTSLPTRPALDRALADLLAADRPTALAVLDVDHFLEVNTQYGHEVGDAVLQRLAGLLAEAVPDGAYRSAGDEFVLLLPDHSLEQAFLRLEELRRRVQSQAADFDLPNGRPVLISLGVAQYPRDARTARGLLSAADVALGAVKENGGNAVGLPFNEEMVMKSCYYAAGSLRRLKALAERLGRKESPLLREALDDLLRKYKADRAPQE